MYSKTNLYCLVLLLIFKLISAFTCPESTGQFPDPEDNTKFYNCFDGIANSSPCPKGLVFNADLKICDHKANVLPFTCVDKPDGHYADPKDKTKFYYCYLGESHEITCPDGLVFNNNLKVCDFERVVKREVSAFACPESNGLYADPESKYRFYECYGGIAHRISCPSGLAFNDNTKLCDHKVNVLPFACPKFDGIFADPEDPSKFYSCVNGEPHSKSCPSGLVFNAELQVCDWGVFKDLPW